MMMAAESEAAITSNSDGKSSPSLSNQITSAIRPQFGHIRLDISNSVLPFDKLGSKHIPTISGKDGLDGDVEMQIRSFSCEMIQLAGKLLRLPQVSIYNFLLENEF